jgi:hypothetical protein
VRVDVTFLAGVGIGGGSGGGGGVVGGRQGAKGSAPRALGKLVDEVEDENKAGMQGGHGASASGAQVCARAAA